jgi:hypothetical protein
VVGDERHMGGLVALPAMRNRREIGAVGLDEQAVQRHEGRHLLELGGARKGHDSGQRQVVSGVQDAPGGGRVAGEAVEDHRDVPGLLLRENRERVVLGLARVDDDRQAALPRQRDLGAEHGVLRVRGARSRSGSRARFRRRRA